MTIMQNTIWKFPLEITDRQTVRVPANHTFLAVQMQHGAPCLWASVDSRAPLAEVEIEIIGTGNPMPSRVNRTYIGTVQQFSGQLVWHVFNLGAK